MARKTMPLSPTELTNAKPKEGNKTNTLFDGNGLFLLVPPDKIILKDNGKEQKIPGTRLWRLKYKYCGKDKLISLGKYPEVSLADARKARDKAFEHLLAGKDPGAENRKKVVVEKIVADGLKAGGVERVIGPDSLEAVAREWHAAQMMPNHELWDPDHAENKLHKLNKDLFPWIGSRPIADIEPPELLEQIRRVAARGALDGAHRLLYDCTKIWAWAIGTGRCKYNSAIQLKGILPPVSKKGHYAAPTTPESLAPMLIASDHYHGTFVVKQAVRLVPLVFLRPGELRAGEWSEVDFEKAIWEIPGPRMKMDGAHIVPLSRQALDILKELHPLTKDSKYIFPHASRRDRYMSENTINAAFHTMGFGTDEVTAHGFRATARTIADEILDIRKDFLEHQLSHVVKDANGEAYNRTKHLPQRREMMQQWADYLDEIKADYLKTKSRISLNSI